jgi:hypothetical protein
MNVMKLTTTISRYHREAPERAEIAFLYPALVMRYCEGESPANTLMSGRSVNNSRIIKM